YTGHEHFMGVALIHMNGRMYDAKLGRFLSPDNFIQEPFSTQSFNRFGYVWNNPLKFTDPSGEEFITAVLIGALIGATAGAMGYIINAAITGQWNWGNFGMS
ncbi:RHS repeat domain-containing protein, partial [Tenacibaculum maritimum]